MFVFVTFNLLLLSSIALSPLPPLSPIIIVVLFSHVLLLLENASHTSGVLVNDRGSNLTRRNFSPPTTTLGSADKTAAFR